MVVRTAKIKSGSFSGNGSATQAITGVGFKPVFIVLTKRCNSSTTCNETLVMAWKDAVENAGGSGTARSGTWWAAYNTSQHARWASDGVRSFDHDGFTVGDGSYNYLAMNGSGNTYTYVAIGGGGTG